MKMIWYYKLIASTAKHIASTAKRLASAAKGIASAAKCIASTAECPIQILADGITLGSGTIMWILT